MNLIIIYTCPMKMNIDIIEKELKKRDWSKYHLAKEMGINPNTLYSNLEKGSFKTVESIAKILGLSEKDLVI